MERGGVEMSDANNATQFASNTTGLVIIGHSSQVDDDIKKRSFELQRNSLKNIAILTYDELLIKAKTHLI